MDSMERSLINSFNKESKTYDADTDTFHHKISTYVIEQKLREDLELVCPRNILDAGGGTGKFSVFLGRLGYTVTLLDISPGQVEIAQEKIQREKLEIPCIVGNCEKTHFQDQSFDFILSIGEVFSYTPNPEKLLTEFRRILKPDGVIWFNFFNSRGWAFETNDPREKVARAAAENSLIQMPDWDYPARIFSKSYVSNLLSRLNFEIQKCYGLISLSHSLPLETRYSKDYSAEILRKYCDIELDLSSNPESIGTAWSNIIVARKMSW